MRLSHIATVAAAVCAAASPLAAQTPAADYDRNASITLDGTADTVTWSMTKGKLTMNVGGQTWDIALPDTPTMLAKGLSANVLSRDTPVRVHAFKAKDGACTPRCRAEAVDITIKSDGKTYALLGAGAPG